MNIYLQTYMAGFSCGSSKPLTDHSLLQAKDWQQQHRYRGSVQNPTTSPAFQGPEMEGQKSFQARFPFGVQIMLVGAILKLPSAKPHLYLQCDHQKYNISLFCSCLSKPFP